jgi:Cu-Zn family superoxide dismutase
VTFRGLARLALLTVPLTAAASPRAAATLRNAAGKEVGQAAFVATRDGVRVQLVVSGLAPGKHGVHLHAVGRCDAPDFTSAGGHFNPAERQHGLKNPKGAHAGDLPNLVVGKDGKGKLVFNARGASLGGEGKASLLGPQGSALVVHAGPDDEKSDPAGNSGARIACGVVERPR